MNFLYFGDVVGRTGRKALAEQLPDIITETSADFTIVNAENAAGGFGCTPEIARDLLTAGANAITTGDHVWDQEKLTPALNSMPELLRAANFPKNTPGSGLKEFRLPNGKKIAVIHVMCQVFMKLQLDNPFTCLDRLLEPYHLGKNIDAIFVDMHGEATSEKMALGKYLDGRVSVVVGSHTHVPTADAHIMPGGTAYQTDAGMCGCYDSVIGFDKTEPLNQFIRKRKARMKAADGEATLCGLYVKLDPASGLACEVSPIKRGGHLVRTTL
jgi:metallophosphoesterase (TIGR00282 family)